MTEAAPDTVVYNDTEHSYVVNGERYPSVTEVLSPLCDFDRVPRDILERKRQIGRAVHRCIELHLLGELDESTVDDAVAPYFESFLKLIALKPVRLIKAEHIVYSRVHRVAGRLDLVWAFLDAPDVPWLIDAKAVAQMTAITALQTAAYEQLWNERMEPKIQRRAGLQLQPDGSLAKMFPYIGSKHRNDWNVFLNALNLTRWIQLNAR